MTTTTDPVRPAAAPVLEEIDPALLVIDLNIRDSITLDDGLVSSVRELGVLEPVVGCRTEDGAVRVLFGHRRTLAAIEAGLPAITVVVTEPSSAGSFGGHDVSRILGQYAENTHRAGLTASEQAGVATQLLDLGLTTADVAERTRLPETAVAAARAIRASRAASAAAVARPELTLDQVAGIAELGDDEDTVAGLVTAAEDGAGAFRHALERARTEKAEREARDAITAKLTAEGVTISDRWPAWTAQLENLHGDAGKKITPRGHKACPGHSAYLQVRWDSTGPVCQPVYFCADPRANGHKAAGGGDVKGADVVDLDKQRAERQRVLAGNKAWRSAEKVRREWLTEFAARKAGPADAFKFIAGSLARRYDFAIRHGLETSWIASRQILGLKAPAPGDGADGLADGLAEALERASGPRALVITLTMILGAYEDATSTDTWRLTGYSGDRKPAQRYLSALAAWGYELSPIEQSVADGEPWQPETAAEKPAGSQDQAAAGE